MVYDPSSTSEFSMDFSLFYRLDQLFQRLDLAALSLDVYKWYNLILVLYKEVAPLINIEDREPIKAEMKRLIPLFAEMNNSINQTGKFSITADTYEQLQDLEISLRDIVNKKGVYLRIKRDRSFGIE